MSTIIKSIFFDLGNVLVKLKPEMLAEGFAPYCKAKKGEIIPYVMEQSKQVDRYMEGKSTSSQFYTNTCKYFKMKIKYYDFYEIWNSMFDPYPEMDDIIRTLKKDYPEIKLLLLSNTNEAHYGYIKEKYKILEVLDHHVVSHEVGAQKPDPKIFNEALKIAGSISKNTFYTDDRQDLIDAARVMGLRAFQFTDHESFSKQLSKFEINV